jgi:hypothetical protein
LVNHRLAALKEGIAAEIVSVQLDQVEGALLSWRR